jgi:hypothetical protein
VPTGQPAYHERGTVFWPGRAFIIVIIIVITIFITIFITKLIAVAIIIIIIIIEEMKSRGGKDDEVTEAMKSKLLFIEL